jgi:thiamine-monophosphate kinase
VRLGDLGELGLIRRIRASVDAEAAGVRTGIGDDTAVLEPTASGLLLATTDLLIEHVHFRRATATAADIGWKALAVNLSDIAAMGGVPRWALVGLAVPEGADLADVDQFYAGMREAGRPHGVVVVGGDTAAAPGGWMVAVTVLGEHRGQPRLRSAARPGHVVAVTGALGRSAAGLRLLESDGDGGPALPASTAEALMAAHRRPIARVAEGQWLAGQAAVHAMMDLSDGLSTDLGHVCRESGVGARVQLDRIPMGDGVREAARVLGDDVMAWAVSGGEDYELLVTLDHADAAQVCRGLEAATGTALTVVGEITAAGAGLVFVDQQGQAISVGPGYEHFRSLGTRRG